MSGGVEHKKPEEHAPTPAGGAEGGSLSLVKPWTWIVNTTRSAISAVLNYPINLVKGTALTVKEAGIGSIKDISHGTWSAVKKVFETAAIPFTTTYNVGKRAVKGAVIAGGTVLGQYNRVKGLADGGGGTEPEPHPAH